MNIIYFFKNLGRRKYCKHQVCPCGEYEQIRYNAEPHNKEYNNRIKMECPNCFCHVKFFKHVVKDGFIPPISLREALHQLKIL